MSTSTTVAIILITTIIISSIPSSLQLLTGASSSSTEATYRINISENIGDSVYPSIALFGGNVYVVWQDDNFGESVSYNKRNSDILLKRSVDGGENFLNVTNLSNDMELSVRPIITAFEKNVYVVWIGDDQNGKELWFRKSTDGGATFSKPIVLAKAHYTKDHIIPTALAAFENNVYVAWRDLDDNGKSGNILFKASSDRGDSFEETKGISSNAVYSSSPKVAANNKNVYVVWDVTLNGDRKNANDEGIFLVKSSDGGRTFENATKLNNNYEFGEAEVVTNSDAVYIAWTGSVYNPQKKIGDVFLATSVDDGDTFKDTNLINEGFEDSENIELAVTNERIGAVWQDKITGNGEIYYKTTLNNNTQPSFREKPVNLSGTEGLSECPSAAISGNTTYVTWEDNTYGNHEIFLKLLF
jgi:hypothetical protein